MHCGTIDVRDTGRGIPEHLHPKLFQRFSQIDSTTTRQHGGAGLGLAISKRLSEILGGSLDLKSRAGEGDTFRFVFRATVVAGLPQPGGRPRGRQAGERPPAP